MRRECSEHVTLSLSSSVSQGKIIEVSRCRESVKWDDYNWDGYKSFTAGAFPLTKKIAWSWPGYNNKYHTPSGRSQISYQMTTRAFPLIRSCLRLRVRLCCEALIKFTKVLLSKRRYFLSWVSAVITSVWLSTRRSTLPTRHYSFI